MPTFFGIVRSSHLQEHIRHLVVEEGWGGNFAGLPPLLRLSTDYQPKELHPEGERRDSLAQLHTFKLYARGSVEGPVDVRLDFYGKVRDDELIKEDPILLHMET